jgi:subtilisin family serine protease
MSIGGSKSAALNSAIAALTKAGVIVVVAAGNDNVLTSPHFLPLPNNPLPSTHLISYLIV